MTRKRLLLVNIGVTLAADTLIILMNLPVHAMIPNEGWSLVYSGLSGLAVGVVATIAKSRINRRFSWSQALGGKPTTR